MILHIMKDYINRLKKIEKTVKAEKAGRLEIAVPWNPKETVIFKNSKEIITCFLETMDGVKR